MMEVGPGSEENNLSAAQPQARHDFSVVQGFQVVGAEDRGAARTMGDQAWRDALRLELEARAARFNQAVDAAIVLSNDGIIRWLGDPVARLSPGPSVLNPGAVIFADELLPAASRDMIKTRIELWIAAMTRRVLAPLFALEAIQEGPESVRDLAHELARSLGILEREPIKARIQTLAQDDRAELRKQGVRFGAYYIFVPALIKPAPRTLALQLWSLQAPGDADEFLRTLGPVASSGRTSLSLDRGISKESYRLAGYRSCGERIVRVDVVERLAGMIRAAIVEPAGVTPGRPSHRPSKGFVVSGQMTSLTGCSGEQFASILRSLGFRTVEMKRSEFFESTSVNELLEQGKPLALAEVEGLTEHDQASSLASCEKGTTIAPILASPAPLLPDDVSADLAPSNLSPEQSGSGSSGASAGAESDTSETSDLSRERAKNDDTIVVWRPDRSQVRHNRGEAESKHSKSKHSRSETPRRSDASGRSLPSAKRARNARETARRAPTSADRPDTVHADEKHRQRASDCDMPRLHPSTGSQHRAKVDPDSPFAKLLELRTLLEGQATKRP
jgi:ATP-dependent RNA helicase SUPV3L1/SUV3